ncbi:MAG: type II toxin-antitoxin system VapC family toxin [Acidimicrobiales bacterium]|nr:type II toxin-antitoxin system VapC family toxin [Acidimicrobiales bacterium]
MITYIDTSTLLKLLVEEDGSDRAGLIWDTADVLVSVALIVVEGRAALAAAQRGRRLSVSQHRRARDEFAALLDELAIVEVTEDLLMDAANLAEDDGLRGYDAVHLAAALAVEATVMSSADTELCNAAERHGIYVANPLDP